MHDFITKSIQLHLVDPPDPSKQNKALLSLVHLVRMVPQYYVENDGKRMVTDVGEESVTQRPQGIKRSFIIGVGCTPNLKKTPPAPCIRRGRMVN